MMTFLHPETFVGAVLYFSFLHHHGGGSFPSALALPHGGNGDWPADSRIAPEGFFFFRFDNCPFLWGCARLDFSRLGNRDPKHLT